MAFVEQNQNGLIYMSSTVLPARHAFLTRFGGVSTGPFASLNLGSNRGDDPEAVRENYRREVTAAEIAKAAEAGGADVISLINTLTGMKIDIERRTFALANKTGGMSGPAIKPIAVRMVWQCAQAVKIPIIGMGGIRTAEDAIEFMLAGASAISVGTANFINPHATIDIIEGMEKYMERHNIADINELVGAVR